MSTAPDLLREAHVHIHKVQDILDGLRGLAVSLVADPGQGGLPVAIRSLAEYADDIANSADVALEQLGKALPPATR